MRVSAAIKAARVLEQHIALDYWLRDRCAESMPSLITDAMATTRAHNAGKASAFAAVIRKLDSAPGAERNALHWEAKAIDELHTAQDQESGGEKFSDSLLDQVIALKEEKVEISGKFIAEIVALKAERSALNAVIDALALKEEHRQEIDAKTDAAAARDQPAHVLTCSEADFLQDDAGDQI